MTMYQDYASSSSNDVGYNIKEYNTSSNRWIECNDITADDFDIITSRFSVATDKFARKQKLVIILENFNEYYKLMMKFLKRAKEKDLYTNIFHRHKKRNEFFVYDVKEDHTPKRLLAEREWYKKEYARQVGEPKPMDNEVLLKKATAGLIRQSKCIPLERICYAPPLKHVSTLEQVNWKDTPLAITCTCPADLCVCSTRKSSLLPPAKIPSKKRPDRFGIKSFCWAIRFLKYPKPAGTLISKLVEAVKKEAEYYRSEAGRKALNEKGPEFCMSGCLQYLVSSMAVDAALAAEIAKMQAKIDVGGLGMFQEGEEGAGGAVESVSAAVCDEFSCSVATQTENNPDTGELVVGDYSSVLYGSIDDSVMNDVEGMKLQISTYSHEPPDPCAFNITKVLHVKEIKQHISKIKEMYSTMSAARESYCCDDVSCQFRGLSLIESLGSMLGQCKCKPASSKESNIGESTKAEASDVVPEEPEIICPPILQRIVEMKNEISDLFKKYFRRIEAPHPCRKKSSVNDINNNIKQKTVLGVIDNCAKQETKKNTSEVTPFKEIDNNKIKQDTAFEVIDRNITQDTALDVVDNNIIQDIALEVIDKDSIHDTVLKVTDTIVMQDSALKVNDNIIEQDLVLGVDKNVVKEMAHKIIDTNVKPDTSLKLIKQNIKREPELEIIDSNIKQETSLEMNRKIIKKTILNPLGENIDSSKLTKEANDTRIVQTDVLESFRYMKKIDTQNEILYHKEIDCTVEQYSVNEDSSPSGLERITLYNEQSNEKDSENFLIIVKSQPGLEDESKCTANNTDTVEENDNSIQEVHKSSIMKIHFAKDFRSSFFKSSTSVKRKSSSIAKLSKTSPNNLRSAGNSEEFYSSGVLTMISRKVSNSGWRGWFSFTKENDKDMRVSSISQNQTPNTNIIRFLGKLESRENAIKKYEKKTKSMEHSMPDDQSYYIDEVVQNVESLRNLNSIQTTGNSSNTTHVEAVDDQKSDPKLPKYYRFYY